MLALVKEQRPERDRRDTCGECATRDRCIMGSLPQAGAGIGPARRERPFQQGEAVTREGELSRHLRIVKVGWVFLCRTRLDGSARPVAIAGRGAMLGSFSYMRQPNPVSAVTGSSVRACEFGTEQIQSLASNDPGFRQRLEKVFCDNVGLVAAWSEATGYRTVTAQVAASVQLLAAQQRSTSVAIPSHTALASLLGTTRESVARALAGLESAGYLLRKSQGRCEVFPGPLREWLTAQK
jgi:CRP-like cAMP-binding protein